MKKKKGYRPFVLFYISESAKKISIKEITIEDIIPKYKNDVLEVCKIDYKCNGYGDKIKVN